jgi:hypothetical protein
MMAVLYRLVDPPNADGVRFILEHQIKAGPFVALLGLGLIALATARRIRVRER